MEAYYKTKLTTIYHGDSLEVLKELPDECVQMCVTSPPYWGLRDYGHDGQIGLEKTPEKYVENLVAVFREIKRTLKTDGTLWLNLGDCYAGNCSRASENGRADFGNKREGVFEKKADGLKPKDLVGIPWRVAFALQADGWYLRQDIIWSKPNPMPESVTDRCTKSHEYIFLLAKSKKYYYDHKAILEPAAYDGRKDTKMKGSEKYKDCLVPGKTVQGYAARGHERWPNKIRGMKTDIKSHSGYYAADGSPLFTEKDGIPARNKRTVWTVCLKPYQGAHFAVYPPELITPCILAGSRNGDVVLDPFFGSGTTAAVAEKFGRKCIGIELNSEYGELEKERIKQPYLNLTE